MIIKNRFGNVEDITYLCCMRYNAYTTDQFIQQAKKKHGDKYDYSKTVYMGAKNKVVITCPIHGDFEQEAYTHKTIQGCKKCGVIRRSNAKRESTKDFVNKAQKIHKNIYDYSESEYIGRMFNIDIICRIHGKFTQLAGNHLSGKGCMLCGHLTEKVGFTKRDFIKASKNGNGTLYLIECYNEKERFLKLGITVHPMRKRFPGKHAMPYKYKVLTTIIKEAGEIYSLEKEFGRRFSIYKYNPDKIFHGKTECLNISVKEKILYDLRGNEESSERRAKEAIQQTESSEK